MKDFNVDELNIAFFGTPEDIAVTILDELAKGRLTPSLIVTAPDRHVGRGMKLTPPPTKVWAERHNISVYQPEKLNAEIVAIISEEGPWDLFIVAAYGKILPKELLGLPKHGTLNAHPSLLPKYRGATPIPAVILAGDEETGVSIMLVDEEMDHGPIIAQERMAVDGQDQEELGINLSHLAGKMLVEIIPKWVAGKITAKEQNHSEATYTKKIAKADGEINLSDDAVVNFRKFCAYSIWPRTYFFTNKGGKKTRVIITDAAIENGAFVIKKVIPEGGKEMLYEQFLKK